MNAQEISRIDDIADWLKQNARARELLDAHVVSFAKRLAKIDRSAASEHVSELYTLAATAAYAVLEAKQRKA